MKSTLQELCELGVAIDICNDPYMKEIMFATSKHLLELSRENYNIEEFKSWRSTFLEEISKFLDKFPHWLLGKIKHFIPLVSIEILKWARFHRDIFSLSFEFSKKFISRSIFTTTGVIDREKAAKALMEEKSLKPSTLFRIGSYYGLSEEAMKYWTQVPDFEISCLRNTDAMVWSDFLLGYNNGTNFSYDVLKAAVDSGSEVSFCYYWIKLDDEGSKEEAANYFAQTFLQKLKLWKENRECVDFMYLCEPYINMLKFLMHDFAIERLRTFLKEHKLTYWVLTYLLHWPYQSSFLKTVRLVWEILSKQEFYCLLLDIILKINDPFVTKAYDYRVLFGKLWKESPGDFKRSLFEAEVLNTNNGIDFDYYFGSGQYDISVTFGFHVLLKLFDLDFTDVDEQNVRSIFTSFEVSELRRIARNFGERICIRTIRKGNFRCADLFLECCKVVNLKDFKINLVNTSRTLNNLMRELKFDTIDQLLKWALSNEQFEMFKQKLSTLMLVNLNLRTVGNTITIPSEGSEFMNVNVGINFSVNHFVKNFRRWFINRDFYKVSEFLKWVFPTVQEIDNYVRELSKRYSEDYDIVERWVESRSDFYEGILEDIDLGSDDIDLGSDDDIDLRRDDINFRRDDVQLRTNILIFAQITGHEVG
ncbi:UNVERIFIED_CONTAM: hypothetical protein RMT77_014950 [Armadillidium vulgare]